MPAPEQKVCPRCKSAFVCNATDIASCQCSGVILTDYDKATIAKSYNDCLCRNCLLAMQTTTDNILDTFTI